MIARKGRVTRFVLLLAASGALVVAGCSGTEADVVLADGPSVQLIAGSVDATSTGNGVLSGQATGVYLEPKEGCTITHVHAQIFIDRNHDGVMQPEDTCFLDFEEQNALPGPISVGTFSFSKGQLDPPPTILIDAEVDCGNGGTNVHVRKPWSPPARAGMMTGNGDAVEHSGLLDNPQP